MKFIFICQGEKPKKEKGGLKSAMSKITDSILGILICAGITVLCFLPTLVWLGFYFLLHPEGFWQKAFVFGVGMWLLGGLQVLGLTICIAFWVHILGWAK